eukprot:gene10564-11858_t
MAVLTYAIKGRTDGRARMRSYADDGGITASDPKVERATEAVQLGMNTLGRFRDLTGFESNIPKCHGWCTHGRLFREAQCVLQLRGTPVSMEQHARLLGALVCYDGRAPEIPPAWLRQRMDKHTSFCAELAVLPLTVPQKDRFIGTGPSRRTVFRCSAGILEKLVPPKGDNPLPSMSRKCQPLWFQARTALLSCVTRGKHANRVPELYIALFLKAHRSDAWSATIYEILTDAQARFSEGAALRHKYTQILTHREFNKSDGQTGPISTLAAASAAIGWRLLVRHGEVCFQTGDATLSMTRM